MALLGTSKGQFSNTRNKPDNITIENVSTIKKPFIEFLIERMKPVLMGDKEDEFKSRENLLIRGFLWKFRTIRILMQERKTKIF